jgi:Ca2+-binding RTX toxin-like protein
MATINVGNNLQLRTAIQGAASIDIINITASNLSGVTTLGKLSSFSPAATPFSGYTIQGSTGSALNRTVNNTRIYQQNIDGPYSPGIVKNLTLRYLSGSNDTNALLSATTGNFTLDNVILTGSHKGWAGNGNKYFSLTSFDAAAPITVPLAIINSTIRLTGQETFDQATGAGGSAFLHSWNNNGPVTITGSTFDEAGFLSSFNFLGTGASPSGNYTISNNTFVGGSTVRAEGNRLQNVNATLSGNDFAGGSYLDLYGDLSGITIGPSNLFETIADVNDPNVLGYGIRITAPNTPAASKTLSGINAFTGQGLAFKYVNATANSSYRLAGTVEVEGTTLGTGTPVAAPFSNLIAGGQGSDSITGTSSADWISGDLGNDTLTGGAGADAFVFGTPLNASTNVDTITDFTAGTDQIWLSSSIFSGVSSVADIKQTHIGLDLHLSYPNPSGDLFAVLQGVTTFLTNSNIQTF